jgi:hypothetical protein
MRPGTWVPNVARREKQAPYTVPCVLVEITAPLLGNDVPIALAYAKFSRPETRTVRLVAPRLVRRFLRRRSRLRARGRLAMHHGGV